MEGTMDQGSSIPRLAWLLIVFALSACHSSGYRSVSNGGFSCEIPRDWSDVSDAKFLIDVISPDEVREVGSSIALFSSQTRDREELLRLIETTKNLYRNDPDFTIAPLEEVRVAGTRGFLSSMTRRTFAEHAHRKDPLPAPVKLRSMEVSFQLDGKGYTIQFDAPEEYYEKHRRAFDHLLETLQRKP